MKLRITLGLILISMFLNNVYADNTADSTQDH